MEAIQEIEHEVEFFSSVLSRIANSSSASYESISALESLGIRIEPRLTDKRIYTFEDCVSCFRCALKVLTRESRPEIWAKTQMNLGIALFKRIGGNRKENIEEAISCYSCALEVYTQEIFPEDWAGTQMNLGLALNNRICGNQVENIEEGILCYGRALEVFTRESFPVYWARTRMNLGFALENRIGGNRMESLEEAISCLRRALEVYTRESLPEDWAKMQMHLGCVLSWRISGNRTDNVEKAISCFARALEVYTLESFPGCWAETLMHLGNVLSMRTCGNRMENLEKAISCYRLALEVYTQELFPEYWVLTQINLGLALYNRICGSRKENIEEAISCYGHALEVLSPESFPKYWAMTQMHLGLALCHRIRGNRMENIEEAISYYERALEVFTRDLFPEFWARAHANLAGALVNRISGNRKENIEKAISHSSLALEVHTRESFPEFWALIQVNLGNAFYERIEGNRIENIEKAISCYGRVLKMLTRESFPEHWASTQMNLGNALYERIDGNRMENIEEAISCHRSALEVFTRESFPENWAKTQNHLGNALCRRICGNRMENVEQARSCYERALEVCTRDSFPEYWATMQMNLGNLHCKRSGNRMERIKQAISCYGHALEVHTRDSFPENWAMTQVNLGFALSQQEDVHPIKNIEEEIKCLERASQVWTKESFPYGWSWVCENLSFCYIKRSCSGNREGKYCNDGFLERAVDFADCALSVVAPESDPLTFVRYSRLKALALSGLGHYMESIHSAQLGLGCLKSVYTLASTGILHRRTLMDDYADLTGIIVCGHVKLGELKLAIEACENAKAGLLQSWILDRIVVEEQLSEEERSKFDRARERVRNLQLMLDKTLSESRATHDVLLSEYHKENCTLSNLLGLASERKSKFGTRSALHGAMEATELSRHFDERRVMAIEFFFSVDVPNGKNGNLGKLLNVFCLWNGEIHVKGFTDVPNPDDGIYWNSFLDPRVDERTDDQIEEKESSLQSLEKSYLKQLGSVFEVLLQEVCNCYMPYKLLIVPHLGLHKIPFAAVPLSPRSIRSHAGTEESLLAEITSETMLCDVIDAGITIAPSLSIAACLEKSNIRCRSLRDAQIVTFTCPSLELLQFQDPVVDACQGTAANILRFEGELVAPSEVVGRQEVRECDILHFNCHGTFSGEYGASGQRNALRDKSSVLTTSGLYLGRGDRESKLLSIPKIWSLRLQNCRLVCVVACSGSVVSYSSASDECLSIGTAFLVGGARHVVCSLWPVYQTVAVVTISKFYRNLCEASDGEWESISMAGCLRKAQRWYRDLSEEEHKQVIEDHDLEWDSRIDNKDYCNWAAFTILGPPE